MQEKEMFFLEKQAMRLNKLYNKTQRMKQKSVFKLSMLFVVLFITLAWHKPLPKLFLIGDSISIQYGPYLKEYLKGTVNFERKEDDGSGMKNLDVPTGANGGDSRMVLEYLKVKLNDPGFNPDYLLLNCGLHDIKRNTETQKIQVNEEDYKNNLAEILTLLRENEIQLIWIRTTPVVDSIHNSRAKAFQRFASDLKTYNNIADELFTKEKIPMIDLNGFTEKLGVDQFIDHVHYNETTRAQQAAFIAGFIESYLNISK